MKAIRDTTVQSGSADLASLGSISTPHRAFHAHHEGEIEVYPRRSRVWGRSAEVRRLTTRGTTRFDTAPARTLRASHEFTKILTLRVLVLAGERTDERDGTG